MKQAVAFSLLLAIAIAVFLIFSHSESNTSNLNQNKNQVVEILNPEYRVDAFLELANEPTDYDAVTERMRVIVNELILPRLYASSDVNALIIGTVLADWRTDEAEDYLHLALSMNPNDPVLLSVVMLYCDGYLKRHLTREDLRRRTRQVLLYGTEEVNAPTSQFCFDLPYHRLLTDATGDNAWVWMRRALVEDDSDQSLKYLQRAGKAQYYNDYDQELSILTLNVLGEYGYEIDDRESLLLYGLVRLDSVRYLATMILPKCNSEPLKSDPPAIEACSGIAGHLLKSTSLVGLLQGWAVMGITDRLRGDEVRTMSKKLGFNAEDFVKYQDMVVANDPEFRKIADRNALRYVQVDALKQTMIHFGLIEGSDEKPRRISAVVAKRLIID